VGYILSTGRSTGDSTMADIVVAASIDNELTSKNVLDVKRLKDAGHDVHLYYYLPLIPAFYMQLPSEVEEIEGWHQHAHEMLTQWGSKLNIPKKDQSFFDEILGPDQIVDAARAEGAEVILTSDGKVQRRLLSKFLDMLMGHKDVPVDSVSHFAKEQLPATKSTTSRREDRERDREDGPMYGSPYTKTSERQLKGRKPLDKKKDDVKDQEDQQRKRPKFK
jgi:hypothetical protein